MKKVQVEIYSAPQCSLCEAVKAVVRVVEGRLPFEWREINIGTDPALRRRFRYDIPVVFIDGEERFKHRLDEEEFERAIRGRLGTQVAQSDGADG